MKQIISFVMMSLVSTFVFANGWVGPRPSMNEFVAGGSSGGGVGPRPTAEFFVASTASDDRQGGGGWMSLKNSQSGTSKVDYVKAIEIAEDGKIKFKYMGFDSAEIQTHSLELKSLGDEYLEAIKKSQESRNWEAVPVQ